MISKCPKCGKEYKRISYYEKHIISCQGKQTKSRKKSNKSKKENNYREIKDLISNLDKRIIEIEKKLALNESHSKFFDNSEKSMKFRNIHEFEKEITKTLGQNTGFKNKRGNLSIKEIRKIFLKEYNISNKEFEENIMRLYRKQIIDLQPGGNPADYHLLSPTGKKFYYLTLKK